MAIASLQHAATRSNVMALRAAGGSAQRQTLKNACMANASPDEYQPIAAVFAWLADTRTFTVVQKPSFTISHNAEIVSRHDIPRAPDEQPPWQTPSNHLVDSYGFLAAALRALILARGRYCAKKRIDHLAFRPFVFYIKQRAI